MSLDELWKECNDGRHGKGRNFMFFNCFQTRDSNMEETQFRDSLYNVDSASLDSVPRLSRGFSGDRIAKKQ